MWCCFYSALVDSWCRLLAMALVGRHVLTLILDYVMYAILASCLRQNF